MEPAAPLGKTHEEELGYLTFSYAPMRAIIQKTFYINYLISFRLVFILFICLFILFAAHLIFFKIVKLVPSFVAQGSDVMEILKRHKLRVATVM